MNQGKNLVTKKNKSFLKIKMIIITIKIMEIIVIAIIKIRSKDLTKIIKESVKNYSFKTVPLNHIIKEEIGYAQSVIILTSFLEFNVIDVKLIDSRIELFKRIN